jgi:hypothetical protein
MMVRAVTSCAAPSSHWTLIFRERNGDDARLTGKENRWKRLGGAADALDTGLEAAVLMGVVLWDGKW